MAEIRMTKSDTYPPWSLAVKDSEGAVINISGATFSGKIVNRSTGVLAKTLAGTFNILVAASGTFEYAPVAADTSSLSAGIYDIYISVTIGGKTGERRVDAVLDLNASPA